MLWIINLKQSKSQLGPVAMSKKEKWQPWFKWTHVVDVRDDVGVCGLGEAGPVDLQDLVGDL